MKRVQCSPASERRAGRTQQAEIVMLDTLCAQKVEVPVTSGYAGLLGIFCINLSFAVVTERRHKGVAFGDAGDKTHTGEFNSNCPWWAGL